MGNILVVRNKLSLFVPRHQVELRLTREICVTERHLLQPSCANKLVSSFLSIAINSVNSDCFCFLVSGGNHCCPVWQGTNKQIFGFH